MAESSHSFISYFKRMSSPIIVLSVLRERPMYGDSDWSRERSFSQVRPAGGDPGFSQILRNAASASASRSRPRTSYRQPSPKPQPLPQLRKGDMVRHTAFGMGMVLSVQPMGGDALLEIAFDNVGTKKLMLKTAAQFLTRQGS